MISKLQTLIYVLFATATLTSAALPPGYEDVLLCPKGYCRQRKPGRLPFGPRSSLHYCKRMVASTMYAKNVVEPVAWGTRRENAKAELAGLVQRGFHENTCDMYADENIGGGRVYGEYQKGPYTAGAEYNWDENDADENIGGGRVYGEYQKGPYTAGAEYNWDENDADENIGNRGRFMCNMQWPKHQNCWCNEMEKRIVCGKELLKYLTPNKDGMVKIRGGRGWRYVNPLTGRVKFPGPNDGPVYKCGKNEQCVSPSKYCTKCVGKNSTKDSFDKYLADYVDAESTADVSSLSLDDSATASVAAAAKMPKSKDSANTKKNVAKIVLWCGSGAFVALIIGGLIYRKVRSQRDRNYVDMDTSNFISKRERNYSISNSNQVYESPHVVNIVV